MGARCSQAYSDIQHESFQFRGTRHAEIATMRSPEAGSIGTSVNGSRQRQSVVLADDHPVVLRGLESLIRTDPLFRVVQTCTDGSAALEAIGNNQPSIAVLDINMPRMTGLEVLHRVAGHKWPTKVVLLTASVGDRQIVRAIADGAFGIILKEAAADTLLDCLHASQCQTR